MVDFTDFENLNPEGETLSSEARRNLISSTISGFILQGYSASKALQGYRSAGLGIRSSDFYDIYSAFDQNVKPGYRIQSLDDKAQVFEGILATGSQKIPAQYQFIAEISYRDLTSNEMLIGHFFLDTDTLGSKEYLEDLLLQYAREHESYTGKTLFEANIIVGFKRPQ